MLISFCSISTSTLYYYYIYFIHGYEVYYISTHVSAHRIYKSVYSIHQGTVYPKQCSFKNQIKFFSVQFWSRWLSCYVVASLLRVSIIRSRVHLWIWINLWFFLWPATSRFFKITAHTHSLIQSLIPSSKGFSYLTKIFIVGFVIQLQIQVKICFRSGESCIRDWILRQKNK